MGMRGWKRETMRALRLRKVGCSYQPIHRDAKCLVIHAQPAEDEVTWTMENSGAL